MSVIQRDTLYGEILDALPDVLQKCPHVQSFITSNAHLVDPTLDRTFTNLSNLMYPSKTAQPYNFTNIIGVIKQLNYFKGSPPTLIIYEAAKEKTYRILLANCEIARLKQDPRQVDDFRDIKEGSRLFSGVDSRLYPNLCAGNLVMIRDLCLGTGHAFCPHPNQIKVIHPFKPLDQPPAKVENKLSKAEFVRIIELIRLLLAQFCKNLVPEQNSSFVHATFSALVLAKRVTEKFAKLFLLVPFLKTTYRTILGNHPNSQSNIATMIATQIETSAFPSEHKPLFTRSLISKLIEPNQLVVVVFVFGEHMSVIESVPCLDVIAFLNVHIKPDKRFPGMFVYMLHDNIHFGQGCLAVDSSSILGGMVWKTVLDIVHSLSDVQENKKSSNIDFLQANENLSLNDSLFSLGFEEEEEEEYISSLNDSIVSQQPQEKEDIDLDGQMHILRASIHPFHWKTPFLDFKRERAILELQINMSLVERVDSLNELVNKVAKESGLRFFRLKARMIDFKLQDSSGKPILNTKTLLNGLIRFVCTNSQCGNAIPFAMMRKNVQKATEANPLPCNRCNNSMNATACIQICLEDCSKTHVWSLLASPQFETFFGCTMDNLIYQSQPELDIYQGVTFMLNYFCPSRKRMQASKFDPSEIQYDSNLLVDFIVECRKVSSVVSKFTPINLLNDQLFGWCFENWIFYIRAIYE